MSSELKAAVWAFSALRVAVERDVLDVLRSGTRDVKSLARDTGLDASTLDRLVDVLAAWRIVTREPAGEVMLTDEGSALAARGSALGAELAATAAQAGALVDDARRSDLGAGWHHVDPEAIRSQGQLSQEAMASVLPQVERMVPALRRLAEPGATFLDVGLGAAGGSIAICRRYPSVRVVGLEPLPLARLEARAAIACAGLGDRIAVRAHGIEAIADEAAFDVAYVASMFIPDELLARGLERVRRALRPGGLVLLGAFTPVGDARVSSAIALRWHTWGGLRSARELVRLVENAGFREVREGPTSGDLAPVFALAPG